MRDKNQLTMEQVQKEICNFKKIFQHVRLYKIQGSVPKEGFHLTAEDGHTRCHDFWKKRQRCENCVVRKAFEQKAEKGKLEIFDGKIYQVLARYLLIDGEEYVMELIRCMDSDWSLGDTQHEKLIDMFVHYNDRLYRDAVTDAYNRRYYEDELKHKKGNAGVALLDLDDFKLYNDTYGHSAGDMVLYTVVDVVRKSIRKSDKLIRFGGDEFLLVMPDIDEDTFTNKLELIQERVHAERIHGYSNLRLSVSAGGVMCIGETIESAVERADKLMYQAKVNKNRVITEKEAKEDCEIDKQKILIADDSEMNRMLLAEMLKDEFEIIEAENGKECLKKLHQYGKEISVVLLDIIMPVMDGFEVLSYMNKNRWIEDIPVIMISSEGSVTCIRKAFEFGASDYIKRPFDGKVVYQRVFNTIKLYAKQRRLISLVSDQIHEKEKSNQMMVQLLSQIVEFRNGESGQHVLHIQTLTELLLDRLVQKTDKYQLSSDDCYLIATASAVHDIGKIGIDEKILNKPGKLTKEEFEIMKQHTVIGASMIDKMEQYKDESLIQIAHEICRWHHERYDGKGYPDGLKGEEIPIAAQVVSLSDVYDALVSERVYKSALQHEEAMKMILNGECGAFQPLLLECLEEIQDKILEEIHCK